jgi:hypothetical protein
MSETTPLDKTVMTEDVGGTVIDMPTRAHKAQPAKATADFVREHPALVIAGGIAAGVLIAALLPRRRARSAGKRAGMLGDAVGAAAVTLGKQLIERADRATGELRRASSRTADQAEDLGGLAVKRIGALLSGWLDSAEHFGLAAASQAGKAGEVAGDAASKAGKRLGKAAADAKSRVIG